MRSLACRERGIVKTRYQPTVVHAQFPLLKPSRGLPVLTNLGCAEQFSGLETSTVPVQALI